MQGGMRPSHVPPCSCSSIAPPTPAHISKAVAHTITMQKHDKIPVGKWRRYVCRMWWGNMHAGCGGSSAQSNEAFNWEVQVSFHPASTIPHGSTFPWSACCDNAHHRKAGVLLLLARRTTGTI
eukprot:1143907-Pelagomonas_calceolata.AAC.2